MKKRKQHYVWEHYLKPWTVGDKLWCRRGNKRFQTSTENVAQERDFYRVQKLSAADLAFVKAFVERLQPDLRPMALGWVNMFEELSTLQEEYERSGVHSAEFEHQLDLAFNNLEEDIHAHIEADAIPILAQLQRASTSFVDDDEPYARFSRFIAAQYIRTPGIQQRSLEALTGFTGVLPSAIWGLMRTILASTFAATIHAKRAETTLAFLATSPQDEFVTADQPLVNVRWDPLESTCRHASLSIL